jgi:hypothetical protein
VPSWGGGGYEDVMLGLDEAASFPDPSALISGIGASVWRP